MNSTQAHSKKKKFDVQSRLEKHEKKREKMQFGCIRIVDLQFYFDGASFRIAFLLSKHLNMFRGFCLKNS